LLKVPQIGYVDGIGEINILKVGDKMLDVYEDYIKLVKEKTNELRELANELEIQGQKEFKKVQKEMVMEYATPASNVKKDITPKEKKLKKKTDEPGI